MTIKKVTELKKGDLIGIDGMLELFPGLKSKTFYEWHAKAELEPDKYPRGRKVGGRLFWHMNDILPFVNRGASSKAS